MDFKKVVFTGDFLRPSLHGGPHQVSNIEWLYQYFKPFVHTLLPEVRIERLVWDKAGQFSPTDFYNEFSLSIDCYSWAKIYDCDQHSKVLDRIIEKYFDDTFVIAFELPPILIKALTGAGVTFLNFEIGPHRFLDDLCLEATTNNCSLKKFLSSISLTDDHISCYSGRITANVVRSPPLLDEMTILLVGQTFGDRSLISNGAFLTLDDFVPEIKRLSMAGMDILYKPHPDDKKGMFFKKDNLDTVGGKIIKGNIYRIFSQEKLYKVVGISSSCLYESPFFNVSSHFMGSRRGLGSIVYGQFNCFSFWEGVFGALNVLFESKKLCDIPFRANVLRNSIDACGGGEGGPSTSFFDMGNDDLRNTVSWRMTAPLRATGRFFNRIFK